MLRILFFILLYPILELTLGSCSYNHKSKNLDSWVGKYEYGEEPIKAIAGYYMSMIWTLDIKKNNDSCQGLLEVNGQQTYIKSLTDISGDRSTIAVTFNRVIDGSDENLKKGDTLFVLSRSGNKLVTKWFALEPRLPEMPPKECNCFNKTIKN